MERLKRVFEGNNKEFLLPFATLGLILLFIIPIPKLILDFLLVLSLVFSTLGFLLTLFVTKTLEFSSFPSLLLFLTLFRLGLNIASTRLILSDGDAGAIIETFGDFVAMGNPLVGFILFTLITVINFLVVTKGVGRIAEVSARFTLEALPGKQMLIDADLASQSLTKEEAQLARQQLQKETEFYGQMDGASKFVRGDAIASIVILFVNSIGGVILGCLKGQGSVVECLITYTRLTIGDGLVTQIPALLTSIGAGILLTKGSEQSIGKTLPKELLGSYKALILSGLCILILAFIPGMPKFIMLPLAIGLIFFGVSASKRDEKEEPKEETHFHKIELKLGQNYLSEASLLFDKLVTLRQEIVKEIGFSIPSIQISDDLTLPNDAYAIKIKGVTEYLGKEELYPTLRKKLTQHAWQLINRQDIVEILEKTKKNDAACVSELEGKIPIKDLLKVFQNLLKERIPIDDSSTILETIADHYNEKEKVDPKYLSEKVRKSCIKRLFGGRKAFDAITIDLKVEQMISASMRKGELFLREATREKIEREIETLLLNREKKEETPLILTQENLRTAISDLLGKDLIVISYEEIDKDLEINTIGFVTTNVLI